MLESLQLHGESLVELGDGAGQDDGAPSGVFLHHREPLRGGELPDRREIGAVGAKLSREVLASEMAVCPIARELRHPLLNASALRRRRRTLTSSRSVGIGRADGFRTRQWLTFAALEWMSCHLLLLFVLCYEREAPKYSSAPRAQAGVRPRSLRLRRKRVNCVT